MKPTKPWILIVLLCLLLAVVPLSQAQEATPEASATETTTPEATVTEAATPEATESLITLVPFTSAAYGIHGVVPDGWREVGSGIYARVRDANDPVIIAQQSASAKQADVLNALLPQLGLQTAPDSVGERETAFANWTLYEINITLPQGTLSVDLALAEVDGISYIVLAQGPQAEYEALHQNVFLPAIDAVAPIEIPEPTDYRAEDVTFENGDVTLSGTLTMPDAGGPFAAVVLISGSGGQARDELLGGGVAIAPFRLIAEALTRAGVAVLRYDDRGIGKSTGDFAAATTQDFAADAAAAIAYLGTRSEIDPAQIGVLGHSEGGLVGAMLGARNPNVAFVIAMAGPAVDGKELLVLQNERIYTVADASPASVEAQVAFIRALTALIDQDDLKAIEKLTYDHVLSEAQALPENQRAQLGNLEDYARNVTDQQMTTFQAGWFRSFLNYDPGPDWAQTQVPVLALFGGKDLQVDAAQNAPALAARLAEAGNADYSIVVFPNANHLFQEAGTGALEEYAALPAEFTPNFLPTIIQWLRAHVTLAGDAG